MYDYIVEKTEMVLLKEEIDKYWGIDKERLERLYRILGDVSISKEFVKGYLSYFHTSGTTRGSAPLTESSLCELYEISLQTPYFSKEAYVELMGEYVKDLFDEYKPLDYFEGMTYMEMDKSFEDFMRRLKKAGKKSDEKYLEEKGKLSIALEDYGYGFSKEILPIVIQAHKTCDEILDKLPEPKLVNEDAKKFYEIAKREFWGASGKPYSFYLSYDMALFGEISEYMDEPLIYYSSRSSFPAPFTVEEFLESIEKRKKPKIKKIRKK